MLISLLFQNPAVFVIVAAVLLLSLTLHEWGHAFAADRLGDSTPRRFGRVTLNPAAHLDLFGSLLLLVAGFGFAKPVPVNFARLGRWGGLIVAAAGPAMNILIALVSLALLALLGSNVFAETVLLYVFAINVALAVFNLLPIPLLDGSRIVAALFPRSLGRSLMEFERQPFAFVVVLLFIFIAREPVGRIIGYVQNLGLSWTGIS